MKYFIILLLLLSGCTYKTQEIGNEDLTNFCSELVQRDREDAVKQYDKCIKDTEKTNLMRTKILNKLSPEERNFVGLVVYDPKLVCQRYHSFNEPVQVELYCRDFVNYRGWRTK